MEGEGPAGHALLQSHGRGHGHPVRTAALPAAHGHRGLQGLRGERRGRGAAVRDGGGPAEGLKKRSSYSVHLVIDHFGAFLGKRENRFRLVMDKEETEYSADDVEQILIQSPCSLSADAIRLATEKT